MKVRPRVEVEWRDAQSTGRWRSVSEALAEATAVDIFLQHSCGYLLALTDEYILLAMNYKAAESDADALVADTMQIPRSEVVSIRQLRLDKTL